MRKLILLIAIMCPSLCYAQTEGELREYVEYFAATERNDGSPHIKKCQDYIQTKLRAWGYATELQPVEGCNNVLAWKRGRDPGIIVIGAHLDTVRRSPGADDNATGSAMVLGLAHRYAKLTPQYTIVFAFWTREEDGLRGSRYYVQHPKWPIKDHILHINFDMIGRLHPEYFKLPGIEVNPILKQLASRYPFAKNITYTKMGGSDNVSFFNVGIPIVAIHTGLHRDYHRSSDTPEKINYKGMVAIANYSYDIITEVIPSIDINYVFYNLPTLETR